MRLCFWIQPHSRLNLSANAVSAVQMSQPFPISDYVMLEVGVVPLRPSMWSAVWMSGFLRVTAVGRTTFQIFFFFLCSLAGLAANKAKSLVLKEEKLIQFIKLVI